MALTYNTYTTSLANLLVVPVDNVDFVQVLPNIIDDAEQRIYRELDLLSTVVRQNGTLTSGSRTFNLPGSGTDIFVTTDELNVITPATQNDPEQGTRVGLVPTSREFLDFTFPSSDGAGVPEYYAMLTQSTVLVGPWPDAAYTVEVVGTKRPAPLSASNQTTFLSQYLPDVLLAASMVFASGYQMNFSAMADNPQQGVSWESHLKTLLASANVEEMRKKYAAEAWSSKQPTPLATPPRV